MAELFGAVPTQLSCGVMCTYASCETTSNIGELWPPNALPFRWAMVDYICSSYFVLSLHIERLRALLYISGPNTGCYSRRWPLLGTTKLVLKKLIFFFQDKFYSLKAHTHYFTVLIYFATWRAAKLGIFMHFTPINLLWCSQTINSLMYAYHTDPQVSR